MTVFQLDFFPDNNIPQKNKKQRVKKLYFSSEIDTDIARYRNSLEYFHADLFNLTGYF